MGISAYRVMLSNAPLKKSYSTRDDHARVFGQFRKARNICLTMMHATKVGESVIKALPLVEAIKTKGGPQARIFIDRYNTSPWVTNILSGEPGIYPLLEGSKVDLHIYDRYDYLPDHVKKASQIRLYDLYSLYPNLSELHTAEQYVRPFCQQGNGSPIYPRFRFSGEERREARRAMGYSRPCFLLNPTVGTSANEGFQHYRRLRRWPAGHYISLGSMLLESYRHSSVLIFRGIKEEAKIARLIQKALGSRAAVFTLGPALNVRKLAAFINQNVDMVVGNDSGITHIAAATGVKTLALFGPTDPACWGPPGGFVLDIDKCGEKSFDPEETKCFKYGCPSPCINDIEPIRVFELLQFIYHYRS